ncbi:hypothetical protein OAF42_01310 [Planctomicrobium sp.]|jgi:hypothetical protein|nr:hypothetical protein [Planctomicrobium sp.]MDB4733058.1 hypothetical protein [Planctomicrobium sp.]
MTSSRFRSLFCVNMSTFAIFATVFVGSKIFAYEIVSSGPAKSAAAVVPSEDSEKLQLRLNSDPPNGNLKPPIYTEPEWVSSIDRATHTDNTTEGVIQTSAEVEVTIPPPLTELDAPVSPEAIIENESSIEEKVIEPKVDIRPPVVSSDSEEDDEDRIEPCWTDPFVDDHLLLWRENREELELLFNNGNGFGMTTLGFDAKITGGDGPLWANFKFNWHFLDGPTQPDIRSQTYDLSFEFNHAQQLDEDWGLHLQLAPTWSTDWDNKSSDAFRLIGGGLVSYDCHDGCKFVVGGMYMDRPDLPFVPTAGIRIWEDDFELDLVIPRPRIAWRTDQEVDEETWFYIAGELGGGSWAVERELSRKEILSYRDYRLLVGWETKKVDGSRQVFELGWVFDRQIDFDRFSGSSDLDDTFVMRWGHTY